MSTIGKVSAVFTASTSGLTAGVNAASASMKGLRRDSQSLDSALTRLGTAGAAISAIDPSGISATATAARAAAAAAQSFEQQASLIAAQMQAGSITADQAAASLGQLNAQAQQAAATFERGAQVIAANATAEQRFASTTSELNALLQAGAIDQGTFQRAVDAAQQSLDNATGVTQAQSQAMRQLTATFERGAQVTLSVQSAEERHAATLAELRSLLQAGAISQQTYSRAVDRANDELRQSRPAANAAAAAMSTVSSAASGVTSRLNALIAIQGAQLFGSLISQATRAVQSLIRFGQGQAEVVDQTSKLAARLGFTYGELAGLSLAGDLAGVSMDTIGAAVTRADVAFVRAAEGSRTAAAAFESIGLSIDSLQGMSAAERFDAIAAAIAALPTEAQRAEAAVQLFGRAGAQLLPLFAGGAEGIAAARAEAERFGLALTGMQGQNVEAMNDAFTRAQQAVAGVVQQVVAYLAPAIEGVTTAFSDLVGNVGGATIGQTIGEGILQGARFLAQIGDTLTQNLSGVWQYVSQVGAQWAGVWDIAGRVGSVFAGIGRLLQGAFLTVVGSFTAIGEVILTAVREAAAVLGFDTGPLDAALAGLDAFNNQLNQDIEASFNAAGENFGAALETNAAAVGEAIPGPLTQTIDDAIARAQAAAAAVDVAEKQTIEVQATQRVDARELREAVQGIESGSAEGIREMFRLMRGERGNVQEQQLDELRGIRNAIENQEPDEFEVSDLAPAAGA